MKLEFWGFLRENGEVETLNFVGVMALGDRSTTPVKEIAHEVPQAVALVHPFG